MLTVGIIGYGAIAQFVVSALPQIGAELGLVIARPGKLLVAEEAFGLDEAQRATVIVGENLGQWRPDVIVDCAGHGALREHGVQILRAGVPLITVSVGALADPEFYDELILAARSGGSRLQLSTGAIGALDAIAAARSGRLDSVRYIGRKPPLAWKGSNAESVMNLSELSTARVHFEGSARDAATLYPKNANVAAAVALAGLGFDATQVQLVADPNVNANIHEINASGDFGEMSFSITGKALPNNPRTSALAAMSVVKLLSDRCSNVTF